MKHKSEKIARYIFLIFGVVAVVSVIAITVYMIIKGVPALFKIGIIEFLFGHEWAPSAKTPSFGISYIILSSIVGTFGAVILGVPIGLLTAVFLTEITC